YSEDLQQCVIYQQFLLGKKISDIALDLNMLQHVVECIIQMWYSIGEVMVQKPGRKGNQRRIMTPEEITVSF
ncbi:hypothetical protein K439DRAFT_1343305, partial [Ramaria rubella]